MKRYAKGDTMTIVFQGRTEEWVVVWDDGQSVGAELAAPNLPGGYLGGVFHGASVPR